MFNLSSFLTKSFLQCFSRVLGINSKLISGSDKPKICCNPENMAMSLSNHISNFFHMIADKKVRDSLGYSYNIKKPPVSIGRLKFKMNYK